MKKISWKRVIIAVIVILVFLVIVAAILYWIYVWLPMKENQALQIHFDAIEQRLRAEGKLK